MTRPVEGETRTVERTFTVDEVRQFAAVSGDDQPRYTDSDEDGRVMVQGLLTASLAREGASDDEVVTDAVEPNVHRPVYTGEQITCRSTYDAVVERDDHDEFTATVVCEKGTGETVLAATNEGIVRAD